MGDSLAPLRGDNGEPATRSGLLTLPPAGDAIIVPTVAVDVEVAAPLPSLLTFPLPYPPARSREFDRDVFPAFLDVAGDLEVCRV